MVISSSYKHNVLLIEQDKNLRSYYSVALNNSGQFASFVSASGLEAMHTIEGQANGSLQFILLSAHLPDLHYAQFIQRIKKFPYAAQADIFLFSNEISNEDKVILTELSVKGILPMKIEPTNLINTLLTFMKNKPKNTFEPFVQKLDRAIQNHDLRSCEKMMRDENFVQYLMNSPEHISLLGEYYLLRKENEKCYFLMKDFVNKNSINIEISDSIGPLNCYGKVLCLMGKFKEASVVFKNLSQKSPKNFNQIILEQKQDKPKSLLEKIAGSVELDNISGFFNNRAVSLMHDEDYEGAEGFYKNALLFTNKNQAKILFNLGLCQYKNKKLDEAKLTFERLKDAPEYEDLARTKSILKNLDILKEETSSLF